VTRPHPPLHSPILCRICVIPRTFDFVRVAAVPLVVLDPLARLEEITQNLVENFNVGILTGRIRTLDPYQVPRENVDPQLLAQGGIPRVLVGCKGVPLCRNSLLRDAEVRTAHSHCAVVEHVVHAQPALRVNLCLRGEQRRGGEDQMMGKKDICKIGRRWCLQMKALRPAAGAVIAPKLINNIIQNITPAPVLTLSPERVGGLGYSTSFHVRKLG
jgi:hypothetical protein